jgi:hypothetical protein
VDEASELQLARRVKQLVFRQPSCMQGYKGSCFCELDELFNQNLQEEYQCLLNVVTVEQMSNICDTKELGGDVYYRSSSFPSSSASLSALFLFLSVSYSPMMHTSSFTWIQSSRDFGPRACISFPRRN